MKDRLNSVYITHVLLGCSAFLLWKTFITPYDYFDDLYNPFHFEFWFAVIYWTAAVPSLFLMLLKGRAISLRWRLVSSMIVFFCIMITVPLLNTFVHDKKIALVVTLCLV